MLTDDEKKVLAFCLNWFVNEFEQGDLTVRDDGYVAELGMEPDELRQAIENIGKTLHRDGYLPDPHHGVFVLGDGVIHG